MNGKVKWFDGRKGFGFITPDDGSPEAFVHHSMIRMKGYRVLETGQAVMFDAVATEKGVKAMNVQQTPKHP